MSCESLVVLYVIIESSTMTPCRIQIRSISEACACPRKVIIKLIHYLDGGKAERPEDFVHQKLVKESGCSVGANLLQIKGGQKNTAGT